MLCELPSPRAIEAAPSSPVTVSAAAAAAAAVKSARDV